MKTFNDASKSEEGNGVINSGNNDKVPWQFYLLLFVCLTRDGIRLFIDNVRCNNEDNKSYDPKLHHDNIKLLLLLFL